MAHVDVDAIREKLAEVAGLLGDVTVYAYPPDTVHLGPAGAVIVNDADDDQFAFYHQVGGVSDSRLLFDVTVVVGTANVEQARRLLDAYRSVETARSLVTQLESLPNLSGLCHSVMVVSASPISVYPQANADVRLWAVSFAVEVFA